MSIPEFLRAVKNIRDPEQKQTMKVISFILNFPITIVGLFCVLLSLPEKVFWKNSAVVFLISSFWWLEIISWRKGIKGFTLGNVIMVNNLADVITLNHEFVHIRQFQKYPFIFTVMYLLESFKKGYFNNRFEVQARSLS